MICKPIFAEQTGEKKNTGAAREMKWETVFGRERTREGDAKVGRR